VTKNKDQGNHLESSYGVTPFRVWQPPCWATVYLFVAGVIQFYFVSVPYDADTTYHIAVGRLIQAHGILHSFPWTPFSWLADHYADKELLLHLLLVPLGKVNWITASKITGTLLGAMLLFALYFILRKEKVRLAGIWALLPLIASDVFLFRFSLVRPHLISITLALLLLWAAAHGRILILVFLSAFYPWSYVAFWQIPLMLLLAVEGARFFSGEKVRWKPAAAVIGGVFAGWLLHPNSMNLLALNWIHMIDVLVQNAWQSVEGIELGQEFLPFALSQWAEWLLGCVLMSLGGLVLAWRSRKKDSLALAFALVTIAFGILTARTARFAEYFIPFSVATFGLSTRRLPWKTIPILVLCVLLPYTGFPLTETLHGIGTRIDRIPPSFINWVRQEIPEGAQVFTTEWGHTGTLMLSLPERKFIVALDPTLFLVKDPDLYRVWYNLPREPRPGMAEIIRRTFGARFVISFREMRFSEFYALLSMEPGVRILHASNLWMIYDLGAPSIM
jgi:hypothetical protein